MSRRYTNVFVRKIASNFVLKTISVGINAPSCAVFDVIQRESIEEALHLLS